MLEKGGNGWTRGAGDGREGRKEDGGGGDRGAVHVELAGQMVRN